MAVSVLHRLTFFSFHILLLLPHPQVKALVEGAVERQVSFLSLLGSGAGEGGPMVLNVEVRV